jgi:hypothetical protein
MKSFASTLAVVVFVACLSARGAESWLKDGKAAPNTPSMKSKNGFGAQLFLTENAQLFQDWNKPETPKITPVEKARRNIPILTVILFVEPGTDATGNANVTCDIVVRKPDGGIYGKQKDTVVWRHKYLAHSHALQLSEGYMGIRIEPKDPSGTYTVDVIVRDHIKNIQLPLKTTFEVAR